MSVQLASAAQVEKWMQGLPLVGSRITELHASGAAKLDADWQGGWKQWLAGFKNPAAHPQLRLSAVAHSDGLQIEFPGATGQPATRIDVQRLDLDMQGNLIRGHDCHQWRRARQRYPCAP